MRLLPVNNLIAVCTLALVVVGGLAVVQANHESPVVVAAAPSVPLATIEAEGAEQALKDAATAKTNDLLVDEAAAEKAADAKKAAKAKREAAKAKTAAAKAKGEAAKATKEAEDARAALARQRLPGTTATPRIAIQPEKPVAQGPTKAERQEAASVSYCRSAFAKLEPTKPAMSNFADFLYENSIWGQSNREKIIAALAAYGGALRDAGSAMGELSREYVNSDVLEAGDIAVRTYQVLGAQIIEVRSIHALSELDHTSLIGSALGGLKQACKNYAPGDVALF